MSILAEIRRLDPRRDHQRIVHLSTCYDFPFDTTRALEFALFRTFCVPSVSALLDSTGEFQRRAQKRYEDTDIIVSELMEWGYDSERGRRALRRMNQLHGRFAIANDDFLYVLSTFVFEPIRWNERFGWRRMIEAERLAQFVFWREVGRRMNIRAIPERYDDFEAFNRRYERERFRYSETNARVGRATVDMFVAWFPRLFAPLVRRVIYALLDDTVLDAFGFPRPAPALRRLMPVLLKTRGRLAGLLPARRRPRLRTQMRRSLYPDGYVIERIGPEEA
ncbi:MAG: oxygenase MpaB family protein [Gemmataceae bacterium]